MKINDVIRNFLTENNLTYEEHSDRFILKEIRITIPCEKILHISKKNWAVLSMEIGIRKIDSLTKELKKCEGAEIYDFRKKDT